MATRNVTGNVEHIDGTPFIGGILTFALEDAAYVESTQYTEQAVQVTLSGDASFSVPLVSGLPSPYIVTLPDGYRFRIVVPEGTGDVTLSDLRTEYNGIVSAPTGHTHESLYAPLVHNHDSLYFTEAEISVLLAGKAESVHNHDTAYSPVAHAHEGVYSPVAHNHDTEYAEFLRGMWIPPFVTGRYYSVRGVGASVANVNVPANLIYASPFIILESEGPQAFDTISLNVVGNSATVARLGIYNDENNIQPGTLLADYGTVSLATAGAKEVPITLTLNPGLYWLVAIPGAQISMSGILSNYSALGFSTISENGGNIGYRFSGSIPDNPLPSTLVGVSYTISGTILCPKLRKS